ncbi:MAG: hypothetical protein IMF08_08405 [Proteobacteria bacterium]|nr:hypothetical protein [Pseudomonadota bacterium]
MVRSVIVTARRPAKLFILGLSALGMGVLVYALDRPAGSVAFLPAGMAYDSGFLGPLAGPLPTFLHALAFALITAAFLEPTRRARLAVCGIWVAINWLFEAAQHPAFMEITGIGMPGAFDPLDLLAAPAGAAVALLIMQPVTPTPRTGI